MITGALTVAGVLGHNHKHHTLAQWNELLGNRFPFVNDFLRPTGLLATSLPCPTPGGDHCPMRIHSHENEYVALCGNTYEPQCDRKMVSLADLTVYELDRQALSEQIVDALRRANFLLESDMPRGSHWLPLGKWRRSDGDRECVLIYRAGVDYREFAGSSGLQAIAIDVTQSMTLAPSSPRPGVVVLSPLNRDDDHLGLRRALPLIAPNHQALAVDDPQGVFEGVEIAFWLDGHQNKIELNGCSLDSFASSELRFLRLLLLATKRQADGHGEGCGYLFKSQLELSEDGRDLAQLRNALVSGASTVLREDVARSLIRQSAKGDGMVRLAVEPASIRIDQSCVQVPRTPTKQSVGGKAFNHNLKIRNERAEALRKRIRQLVSAPRM